MNDLQQALTQGVASAAERAEKSFLLPVQASTAAPSSDWLFDFINWCCLFFFVLIVGLMVAFTIKYLRKDPGEPTKGGATHNLPIELAWSILPGFLLVFFFWKGFIGFMDMTTPPDGAYPITVNARQWSWEFTYPNGYQDSHLTVPANTPVVLTMTSHDVLHSFFIPEFRQKMDIVPGKYSKVWFEATVLTDPNDPFHLWCAEYCGTSHSNMLAEVHVLDQKGFEAWLLKVSDPSSLSPEARGKKVATLKGCVACHSADGSSIIGPTWKGIWGRQETLTDGSTVTVDETYVRESILEPNKKVVEGFPPVMTSFQGQITEDEILAIIAYMKTLH